MIEGKSSRKIVRTKTILQVNGGSIAYSKLMINQSAKPIGPAK